MKAAPVLRYLPWILRDAAVRPGLAALVLAGLATFLATRLPPELSGNRVELMSRFVGQFDWLVILIATTGLVSWDRTSGFYRTLFSYPVNPAFYYLVRWVTAGLIAALIVPLVGLGLLAVTGTFPFSGPLLVRFFLKYLLLGGLTFGFSTVIRADWAAAFVLSVVQPILHTMETSGVALSSVTRAVARALPPFHVTGFSFSRSLGYPSTGDLVHVLLYGTGILILTMLVLRYRQLGSGGRA